MANPQDTILLLQKLEALGFDDSGFALLHHFRESGKNETISSHRSYCNSVSAFNNESNNEKIQRRLNLVLSAYSMGGFISGSPKVFNKLAEAAYLEIK